MPLLKVNRVLTLKELATTGMPEEDVLEIRLDAMAQADRELRRGPARMSDKPDDFVARNWNRTWRNGKVSPKETFGVDYDYFNAIIKEAIRYYQMWSPLPDPDDLGNLWYGEAPASYGQTWGVWQNRTLVPYGIHLEGPQVDFGPLVDYGLFIERWQNSALPNTDILNQVGTIHAIARRLNSDWDGAHRIYATSIKPDNPSAAVRERRKEPVRLYPIVRIQTRHFR